MIYCVIYKPLLYHFLPYLLYSIFIIIQEALLIPLSKIIEVYLQNIRDAFLFRIGVYHEENFLTIGSNSRIDLESREDAVERLNQTITFKLFS